MNHEALIANLVEEAAPVKPMSLSRRYVTVALAVTAYMMLLVLAMGWRSDLAAQLGTLVYVSEMLMSLCLIYGGALMAMRLSVPRAGSMPVGWVLVTIAFFIGIAVMLLGQVSTETLKASLQSDHFLVTISVVGVALPVVIGLFVMLRRGAPTQLGWAGAMALMSASATGHFVLRLTGEANNLADVLVWCYSPILFFAIIGVFIGKQALYW